MQDMNDGNFSYRISSKGSPAMIFSLDHQSVCQRGLTFLMWFIPAVLE